MHENQTWQTTMDYAIDDRIVIFNEEFVCVAAHKSNIFGNDFFDKRYWRRTKPQARDLTPEERKEMERATLEAHAKFAALLESARGP